MLCFSVGTREAARKIRCQRPRLSRFVVHIVSERSRKDERFARSTMRAKSMSSRSRFYRGAVAYRAPPRIKEAPVAMECKLVQIIELGRRPNTS